MHTAGHTDAGQKLAHGLWTESDASLAFYYMAILVKSCIGLSFHQPT